jgi:hypothetical protein
LAWTFTRPATAYVSTRQHSFSIRQHTSAYVGSDSQQACNRCASLEDLVCGRTYETFASHAVVFPLLLQRCVHSRSASTCERISAHTACMVGSFGSIDWARDTSARDAKRSLLDSSTRPEAAATRDSWREASARRYSAFTFVSSRTGTEV